MQSLHECLSSSLTTQITVIMKNRVKQNKHIKELLSCCCVRAGSLAESRTFRCIKPVFTHNINHKQIQTNIKQIETNMVGKSAKWKVGVGLEMVQHLLSVCEAKLS